MSTDHTATTVAGLNKLKIDMDDNHCFFYGTLMSFKILTRVIYGTTSPEPWQVRNLTITPAVLHGYSRRKVQFADYPAIIPQEGKSVRGTYVTGITMGDVWRLDRFEGDEYKAEKLKVRLLKEDGSESGEEREVLAYVWNSCPQELEDEEWDYDEFVRNKLHRWTGNNEEYEEADALDPTGGRVNYTFQATEKDSLVR